MMSRTLRGISGSTTPPLTCRAPAISRAMTAGTDIGSSSLRRERRSTQLCIEIGEMEEAGRVAVDLRLPALHSLSCVGEVRGGGERDEQQDAAEIDDRDGSHDISQRDDARE